MIKNLRLVRKNRGISQQQLADVLGISQQSVNKYENHNIEPDIATLIKISDYFGISVDFLIGRSENEDVEKMILTDERYVLNIYRSLDAAEKNCVKTVIETLNRKK